jgi:hypothetical protein
VPAFGEVGVPCIAATGDDGIDILEYGVGKDAVTLWRISISARWASTSIATAAGSATSKQSIMKKRDRPGPCRKPPIQSRPWHLAVGNAHFA